MATCPECGGRRIPPRSLFTLPTSNIKCRWCRAVLALSPVARWIRDIALLLAVAGFSLWVINRSDQDPVLFVSVTFVLGLAALVLVGWLAETLFPLRTVIPRDARWLRKSQPEADPDSEK